jgi:uncharacterized membrane protein YfcA
MEILSIDVLLLLIAVAGVAGLIDAIAGGGGLLTVPALLWAGLPPVAALATNKAQAVFGSFTAAAYFVRRGRVDLRQLAAPIGFTFLGAALGALAVRHLDPGLLERLIPLLLIAFAVYFLFSPNLDRDDRRRRLGYRGFALTAGLGIGFYDGFFGPGTGTFFAAAFLLLLGYDLRRATAGTKVLNFTSNFASLLLFSLSGEVWWAVGLSMGVAQIAGARLGAQLVHVHGTRLIRPLLVAVSVALSISLLIG